MSDSSPTTTVPEAVEVPDIRLASHPTLGASEMTQLGAHEGEGGSAQPDDARLRCSCHSSAMKATTTALLLIVAACGSGDTGGDNLASPDATPPAADASASPDATATAEGLGGDIFIWRLEIYEVGTISGLAVGEFWTDVSSAIDPDFNLSSWFEAIPTETCFAKADDPSQNAPAPEDLMKTYRDVGTPVVLRSGQVELILNRTSADGAIEYETHDEVNFDPVQPGMSFELDVPGSDSTPAVTIPNAARIPDVSLTSHPTFGTEQVTMLPASGPYEFTWMPGNYAMLSIGFAEGPDYFVCFVEDDGAFTVPAAWEPMIPASGAITVEAISHETVTVGGRNVGVSAARTIISPHERMAQ